MFCNKIHEMIPHLEIQYEIQKFQFLGYEFKQKLAKSSTQAYKNDWEIIFITTFFKKNVGNGRYAGKLKIVQFKPKQNLSSIFFSNQHSYPSVLMGKSKIKPYMTFHWHKKKLGSSNSYHTCNINNKPLEFSLLAHMVNNVCGHEVFKLYLNMSNFFYLFLKETDMTKGLLLCKTLTTNSNEVSHKSKLDTLKLKAISTRPCE